MLLPWPRRLLLQLAVPSALVLLPPLPGRATASQPWTWQEIEGPPGSDAAGSRFALLALANGIRCIVRAGPDVKQCQLAVTVGCGSLNDPPEFEGLAHLAEHVTLASDPAGIDRFIDERQGDINAFTGERTTSFYCSFNPRGSGDFGVACGKFAALFQRALVPSAAAASLPIVRQEVGRVDAEIGELLKSPSRQLVEVAAFKARSSPGSPWARLGRGSKSTLRADSEEAARELSSALAAIRAKGYVAQGTTAAAVVSLPLSEAVELLGAAFSSLPSAPSREASELPPPPFPGVGRLARGGAMAVQCSTRFAQLCCAWSVECGDAPEAARQKPLSLLGAALMAPHANSLSSVLRRQGLAPLEVEVEPVLRTRVVARADSWVIWQLEIVLARGAEGRWREAAALAVRAVATLGGKGVPTSTVREAVTVSEQSWRWLARPPTALELAGDLQAEPSAALAVVGSRTFVGDVESLAGAATAVATELASSSPAVTVWASDLQPLGCDAGREGPPLPVRRPSLARHPPSSAHAPASVPFLSKAPSLVSTPALPPPPARRRLST